MRKTTKAGKIERCERCEHDQTACTFFGVGLRATDKAIKSLYDLLGGSRQKTYSHWARVCPSLGQNFAVKFKKATLMAKVNKIALANRSTKASSTKTSRSTSSPKKTVRKTTSPKATTKASVRNRSPTPYAPMELDEPEEREAGPSNAGELEEWHGISPSPPSPPALEGRWLVPEEQWVAMGETIQNDAMRMLFDQVRLMAVAVQNMANRQNL